MDKIKLLKQLTKQTDAIWSTLCEIYPKLAKFDAPKIVLNPYFYRTAGCCEQETNTIELGYKFLNSDYFTTMFEIILPHEIIHQADYNLFGYGEKTCGHGVNWCNIMVAYGLPADAHHHMDIPRK